MLPDVVTQVANIASLDKVSLSKTLNPTDGIEYLTLNVEGLQLGDVFTGGMTIEHATAYFVPGKPEPTHNKVQVIYDSDYAPSIVIAWAKVHITMAWIDKVLSHIRVARGISLGVEPVEQAGNKLTLVGKLNKLKLFHLDCIVGSSARLVTLTIKDIRICNMSFKFINKMILKFLNNDGPAHDTHVWVHNHVIYVDFLNVIPIATRANWSLIHVTEEGLVVST